MIWYIITDTAANARSAHFYENKLTFEELADDCCLLLHYRQVSRRLLEEARPWAICHSGGSALFDEYDVMEHQAYADCILNWPVAQIGLCGGHQIIATKFGCRVDWMRRLEPGEPDLDPSYMPGQFKEWGVYPVQIARRDPLFEGLGETIHVAESHSWEVKALGPELCLLASTKGCRVQAYVHARKLLYGVQFHPERILPSYPDGFRLLRNFFGLARDYAKQTGEAQ